MIPVPVDDEGIDVGAGIALAGHARAAFVTPSHQYPLGMPMSMARRNALVAWARKRNAWIIEDDYDSELRYAGHPFPSLQGLDPDRVIYLGTFSKILFSSLRSEEHTSELQSLMRISYAVFCLKKKKT